METLNEIVDKFTNLLKKVIKVRKIELCSKNGIYFEGELILFRIFTREINHLSVKHVEQLIFEYGLNDALNRFGDKEYGEEFQTKLHHILGYVLYTIIWDKLGIFRCFD